MSSTQSTQTATSLEQDAAKPRLPRVSIEYCVQCRWYVQKKIFRINYRINKYCIFYY